MLDLFKYSRSLRNFVARRGRERGAGNGITRGLAGVSIRGGGQDCPPYRWVCRAMGAEHPSYES